MTQIPIRALGRVVLAAIAALGLLTGCALSPFHSQSRSAQSPSQLAKGAFKSFENAPGYRFKGSMSVQEGRLDFTVAEAFSQGDPSSPGTGSGTLAGKPFTYQATTSDSYLKGQSFWQAYYNGRPDEQTRARGFEDRYASALGNDVAIGLQKLMILGGSNERLAEGSVKEGPQRTIDGRRATALRSGGDTFWVAPGNPDRLVGFQGATGDSGELHDIDVTIASTKAPDVGPPGDSVDPTDPSTLPAQYVVVGGAAPPKPGQCSQNSCAVDTTIRNDGGSPLRTSTVQLTAVDPNTNAAIASCAATIPDIPGNLTQDVGCTISGSAWNAWATNARGAGSGDIFCRVDAQITANPPYIGS